MDKNSLNQFATELSQYNIPKSVLYLALGVVLMLFGYKIKKVAFFLIWFVLGFNLMTWLMPMINDAVPQIANDQLYQILLPIGGGVVLAMMGFTIEKLCVAGIAFALVMMVTVQYFGADWLTLVIGGIIGIFLAAFAVRMMKPAVVVLTSAVGAYAVTLAILMFFPQIDFQIFYWPILIVLGVLGALFQFKTNKGVV